MDLKVHVTTPLIGLDEYHMTDHIFDGAEGAFIECVNFYVFWSTKLSKTNEDK